MSDDLFGVYRSRAMAREYDRSLQQWEEHSNQLKQENERLSKINQQNLYYLGSALGAASEERMSRYALLAYIGSLFSVLNKNLGKEAVRQMLSLDTPEMVKTLNEKLAEMNARAKSTSTGALGGYIEVSPNDALKNEHVMRGYQQAIDMYQEDFGRTVALKSPSSMTVANELDVNGAQALIRYVEDARMPS